MKPNQSVLLNLLNCNCSPILEWKSLKQSILINPVKKRINLEWGYDLLWEFSKRQSRQPARPETNKWIWNVCSACTDQQKDDIPVLSQVYCWRYKEVDSLHYTPVGSFWKYIQSHRSLEKSSPTFIFIFLVTFLERDSCVCDQSCIAFKHLSHSAAFLPAFTNSNEAGCCCRFISCWSHTLNICCIISRGTLLPSTDSSEQYRRLRSGPVTRFVLRGRDTLSTYVFNGITHTLLEKWQCDVGKTKFCSGTCTAKIFSSGICDIFFFSPKRDKL